MILSFSGPKVSAPIHRLHVPRHLIFIHVNNLILKPTSLGGIHEVVLSGSIFPFSQSHREEGFL